MFKRGDHAVVHRFATACRAGSAGAIRSLLTPDVVAVSDGGGQVFAAPGPVRGIAQVAESVCNVLGLHPDIAPTVEAVNGQPGVVLRAAGRVVAVVSLKVTGAKVAAVWIVLNPDKLRHWV
ncbi:sigma-70 family RNA polymerase sigma factor family protein [Kribbella jiaozuonensis]|uniref:Siderophore-interacting protein n=1 Tax=Kribbella jiaozuonensis TaxID=2575441 RepID=A0A4U3LQ34_9ACTN|nr:siderophore-interacting protein [Kribbella jiaozuonensis]TKK76467.1 siderophore-interacting protein [Kribbella jiaozuonensis]